MIGKYTHMQENDAENLKRLKDIDFWIFDLDNTLYPHEANLFSQVDHKMGLFIQNLFDVSYEEAKKKQKAFFMAHGTTLRGLMTEHGIEPFDYLKFVHDIDFSVLSRDVKLVEAIESLPGEKFIYTNASTEYAGNVLDRIGLNDVFRDFFDIHDAEFLPKPDIRSYHKMLEKFQIDPNKSIMFEDIAANLNPAAELGMETVWVRTDTHWSNNGHNDDNIGHETDDLSDWLSKVVSRIE